MPKPRALYVTYNGLLDALGESQILPYLREARPVLESLTVLSFEKAGPFGERGAAKAEELKRLGIEWKPLPFTQGLGKIGKAWDLLKMIVAVHLLALRRRVDFVHYRGTNTAQVGLLMKPLLGVRMVLDMRSLWADQRLDGGLWDRSRTVDRWMYDFSKWVERRLVRKADRIVILTRKALAELERMAPGASERATVIPCCADYDHFPVLATAEKTAVRRSLGLDPEALVVGYLGSLGTWYMLDEMLQVFARIRDHEPTAQMLFISRDWNETCEAAVERQGLAGARDAIVVRGAPRGEVPSLLGACDLMLAFYKPGYSHVATSPTKFAEAAACGVPTVCNHGVGDMAELIPALDAGALVDAGDAQSIAAVAARARELAGKGGEPLRARTRPHLGLEVGAEAYRSVYRSVGAR